MSLQIPNGGSSLFKSGYSVSLRVPVVVEEYDESSRIVRRLQHSISVYTMGQEERTNTCVT